MSVHINNIYNYHNNIDVTIFTDKGVIHYKRVQL